MSRATRWFLVVLIACLAAGAASVVAAAAAVYRSGTISVEVEQTNGSHVAVAVPAGAARAAIALAPAVATDAWAEEIGPYRPAIEAIARELPRLPDCTFVEIDGPNLRIRVAKSGARIVVHVEEDGDRVRVELPLDVIRTVAGRLT
jgi:hypothetical protein